MAAPRAGTFKKGWIAAAFLVWTIVAGKEDDGLVIELLLLEPRHQAAMSVSMA